MHRIDDADIGFYDVLVIGCDAAAGQDDWLLAGDHGNPHGLRRVVLERFSRYGRKLPPAWRGK
jgi:hypothetical protein